jgi:hypothetical protein
MPFLVSHVTIHICVTNWELCSKAFHMVGFELVPSMEGKLKMFHLLLQSYATICMHCANVRPIVASLNNRHNKMGFHILNSNEYTPTLNFKNRQNFQNEWMIT